MMKQKYKTKWIVLITTVLILLPGTIRAAGEPRLLLSTEAVQTAVGQTMEVTLWVEGAPPTLKVQARLTFDPTTLKVVALEHGNFLTKNPEAEAFILQDQFDNEAGAIDYALLLKPDQTPAEGNGLLATITFQALSENSTPIEIHEGFFFTPNGNKVVAQTDSAQLAVGDESAAEFASTEQQAEPGSIAPEVQAQPAPVAPINQEQPTQTSPPEPSETETTPEQERPAEIREPSALTPRRFTVQPPSKSGQSWLFPLLLIGDLGVLMLSIGLIGFVGVVGGWYWLARTRR